MGRVSGKVAMVTGSGMGLGRATSLLLAKEGATLFCTDISPEHGEETVQMIRDAGGTADFMRHDVASVADWDAVSAAVENAMADLKYWSTMQASPLPPILKPRPWNNGTRRWPSIPMAFSWGANTPWP